MTGAPMHRRAPEGGRVVFEDGAMPEGSVPVDREPGPFEDFVGGRWVVTDHRALADWQAGRPHIAEARALKFLEAQLVLAGVDLPRGMLAAEAADRGIVPTALAEQVIEKREAFVARELARQAGQARGDALQGKNA